MDENEVVELELQLDSAEMEKTLERLLEDVDALGEMFKDIGVEMSKLFGALQKSLEKTAANVEVMTQALGKATEAMEKLVQSFSAEGLAAAGEQAGKRRVLRIQFRLSRSCFRYCRGDH